MAAATGTNASQLVRPVHTSMLVAMVAMPEASRPWQSHSTVSQLRLGTRHEKWVTDVSGSTVGVTTSVRMKMTVTMSVKMTMTMTVMPIMLCKRPVFVVKSEG